MGTIEQMLAPAGEATHAPGFLIRSHRVGDLGWVVWRHGVLYAREFGSDEHFESMVARIVADFVDNFDAPRERGWIAERDGENSGSIFLVCESDTVARLRMLLVEPTARGLGVGHTRVAGCLRFARSKRYRSVVLFTYDTLDAARRIYIASGFRLMESTPEVAYGKSLVAQVWRLDF